MFGGKDMGLVKSGNREAAVFDETFFKTFLKIGNGLDRLLLVSLEILLSIFLLIMRVT